MNVREAYRMGRDTGSGIAESNLHEFPEWKLKSEDGRNEFIEMCSDIESDHYRQFSPFEFTAHEFNESRNPDSIWESYERGVLDGITAELNEFTGFNPRFQWFIDGIEIRGNHHSRPLYSGYEIRAEMSESEWAEFVNEFDWYESIDELEISSFFKFKDEWYSIDEFTAVNSIWNPRVQEWQKGFDAWRNDTFFSGILIRYEPDSEYERIQVYTFISH